MIAKLVFLFLGIITIVGLVSYESFLEKFGALLTYSMIVLALLAWYTISKRRKSEREADLNNRLSKENQKEDQDDGEYHNDFSKVPAGTPDPVRPLPRSIGYGYGVGGQTLDEDLERIANKIAEDKKTE